MIPKVLAFLIGVLCGGLLAYALLGRYSLHCTPGARGVLVVRLDKLTGDTVVQGREADYSDISSLRN